MELVAVPGDLESDQGSTKTRNRKLTAKAPGNGCLEYDCFLLGALNGLFSGAFALSFRECDGILILLR